MKFDADSDSETDPEATKIPEISPNLWAVPWRAQSPIPSLSNPALTNQRRDAAATLHAAY